ncbi:hypothetical protein K7432_009916 [Basidiobolus ranarum]|uniref:Carrier domain-containing protein n=1 Tax=Basidiobolus ranarum TaxID=34480 RepID=A0ABR2WPG2_9FUNG
MGWVDHESLNVQLAFSNSHFQQDQGQLFADQFVHITKTLVNNLDTPLKSLNWTPDNEKLLLLTSWQKGKGGFIKELDDNCLHYLVERQVQSTPDNIALQYEDKETVTYFELNQRANRLAHFLIESGVVPDDIVPLCMEKSINMVIAILAVLKSGAAYVPLDPEYPKDRISFIVNETVAKVIITTSNLESIFSEIPNAQLVLLDQWDDTINKHLDTNPIVPQLKPSSLCYLIFTSGSTGTPKGVMLEHRAVVNYITAHVGVLGLNQNDRFLQFTNYTFDASILEFFGNLTVGSCLCLASKNNLLTDLSEMAGSMDVTVAQLTTTVAGLLDPSKVPNLRILQQGGEMMTKPVRDAWVEKVNLLNGYGPTEATVCTIIRKCLTHTTTCTNIGWPMGRNQVFILSDNLEPLPLGAIGELCFGGPQLARGYLNRADLTEKAFVKSPFAEGERLYKSGDLARFHPDGSINILGRKDNQIKLNGLRIELDEVEHSLYQYEEISRASVRLLEVNNNSKKKQRALVAFLTFNNMTAENGPIAVIDDDHHAEIVTKIAHLRELIGKKLPQYMIPTIWVPLTRIPINTSGKTDLKTLERIYQGSKPELLRSFTQEKKEVKSQPNSPIEKILQNVWSEVLNIDSSLIGTDDSFYHLGGDSISAIQVSSQCRQMGVKVSVQSILQHPTIHQLNNYAEYTTGKQENADEEEDEGGVIPFTPIQHQFFAIEQAEVHHFHLSWLVKVKTPIQVDVLQKAMYDLASHHEMLRTRFTRVDGVWEQRLASTEDNNIAVQRFQVSDVEELKANIYRIQGSLNIETGPISYFILYDFPNGEQLMFMTIHHYLIDLISWRVIWEDLEKLLNGQTLSYKSLSFKAWCKLLGTHANSLQRKDWPQQAPIQPLNIDKSKLVLNTMETVNTLSFKLDHEHTKLLFGESNDAYRTEAVDFMLSSLVASYCSTFGSQSLTIATEGHGREPWDDSIEISRTVGWFTSIYPVTVDTKPGDTIIDVLKRTKDVRKSIPQHGFTYGLLRYLNEECSPALQKDVLQVGFNYLGRFQHLEKAGALLQDVEDKYKFDLKMMGPKWRRMNVIEVEVTMQHTNLCASISYSKALHEEKDISQWLQSWRDSMVEAIHTCANKEGGELTISDLPLLSLNTHELDQLVHEILPQYGEDLVQNVEDIYPCSPIQEGLIIGNLRSPELYHIRDIYKLTGTLDPKKLHSAWKTIIQDLPILRTVFISNPFISKIPEAYLQVVLKQVDVEWRYISVENHEVDDVLKKHFDEDLSRGFPLGEPNIRLCLLLVKNGQDRLIISRHHSINDGWSDKLMMGDLDAVYNNTLRPAVIPYRDYIAYRIEESKNVNEEMERGFWTSYLEDAEPCSFPRLGDLSRAKIENCQLPARPKILVSDLKSFSKRVGVTLFTLIQAAWGLLLQPYYGQDDFVYGIITNGRNMPMRHIDKVVGPCITTSPLRIQYDEETNVIDWLHKLHQFMLTSIAFQNRGLQKINQWCKSRGIAIEFDTILNFQTQDEDARADESERQLTFESEGIIEPTEYKLTLNAWTENGELGLRLDYTSDTLTHSLAKYFLDRMEVILGAIIKAGNDTKIRAVPNMTKLEENLIHSFNTNVVADLEPGECLHHLFEKQVAKTPGNIAIQYEDSDYISYDALNKQSNQLAHLLVEHGVKPDSMVVLCLEKSINQMVAIFAVLKAGGAYVPLDPNTPVERNRFITSETKSKVVITIDRYKQFFEGQATILLDTDKGIIDQYSAANPIVENLTSSNLCYILFTSGSTGTPKGVMLEHSAVSYFILAQQESWNLTEEDSVLQFSNYNFDISVMEIFLPLAVGARMALAPKERLLTDLEGSISMMNVTSTILTPTVASFINPEKVPTIKRIQTGGEMLTTTVRNTWVSHADFYNCYGPTETAVICSINPKLNENSPIGNVGRPIGYSNMYILNPNLQLAPLGVVGEVCVSGPQLARGYFNRPDLTEAAFVKNPYIAGERMYRTGDLARFNTDGTMEMIGRVDNQIKLNGLRIELDEIEHALYEHTKTDRACVLPLVIDSNTNRKALIAFMTFSDMVDNEAEVTVLNTADNKVAGTYIDETKTLAKIRLPSYMVPSVWIPLIKMPTTVNGKIDRKYLSAFFQSLDRKHIIGLSSEGNVKTKCSSPVENILLEIWSETLNINPTDIGVDDSFFNLGGDSISAIRMSSLSRQKGISLSVPQIMQNSTIHEQALVSSTLTSVSKKVAEIRQGPVPLTPIQEYFLETPQPNLNHYNQSWLLRLRDTTSADALSKAISVVLEQHDILRSRFVFSSNEWQQNVLPIGQVDFEVHHLAIKSVEELTTHVHQLQRSLDITSGPLFQFSLYDTSDGQQLIFMTVHHFIIDLVSWRIIWEDLELLLQGQESGYRSMSFIQWSKMLSDYAQELDMSVWPVQAMAKPIIEDPVLLERNTISTAVSLSFTLDTHHTDLLFGKCNHPFQTEATDFMLSSLAIAYNSVFDSKTFTVGMEGHGREPWNGDIDISRTVGWFTSFYPLTVEVLPEGNYLSTLKNVKDLRKFTPNNGITYGILRHLSKDPNNTFKDDKIQISFNYLGRFQQLEKKNSFFQQVEAPYIFDTCEISEEWKRNHVFEINAGVNHNRFEAEIVYSSALHSKDLVAQWLQTWQETLTTMITQSTELDSVEYTRSDFPLLSLSEQDFNSLFGQILPQIGVDSNDVEDVLPCTHLQEGLIAGMIKASDYYHVQQIFELSGDFDFVRLQNSWNTVIQDHPILRTIFAHNSAIGERDSTFLQVVLKSYIPQWQLLFCTKSTIQEELDAFFIRDKATSFKLGQPNMRFTLLEADSNTHIMIISWHHSILDATSWNLVLKDVYAVYNNLERPRTYPFKKFVSSIRNRTDKYIHEEKGYWQNMFSFLDILPFPKLEASEGSDSSRITLSGFIDVSMHDITLFAQQSKVTIFTLIKAVWALLLKSYTQSDDIVFGYTMSGRNSELEGVSTMIGPCINTLPCRIRCSHDTTISELLTTIHKNYTSAFSYQQSSLRDIQNWAGVSPLFDTIIDYKSISVLQNEESSVQQHGNSTLEFKDLGSNEATEYPLGLSVESDNFKMTYNVIVSDKIASEPFATSLAHDFKILFENLVRAEVDTKLEHLNLYSHNFELNPNEHLSTIETQVQDAYLHSMFEKQVLLTPDHVAVQFETSEFVTYSQLNQRANRLAHKLIELGVTPDTIVPLCLEKSVTMVVAMLAVLKAGGAYVPLDSHNPIERNRFIVSDTKAKVVLTIECYQHYFEGQELVLLDRDEHVTEIYSIENPVVSALKSSHLCYVLFTSGSTGTPKGVMLEHSAVVSSITAHVDIWPLSTIDSVLQFAAYTFDVSVIEIFTTLALGARVALAHKESLLTDLEGYINRMQVTSMMLTTTLASYINPANVPSIKRLMVGGEMVTTAVRNTWAPIVELSNGYGPTEAAVAFLINSKLDVSTSCSNVGTPIGQNRIYILGLDLQPVPLGVVGELCVSGPQLARGYLNRPDLTEAAFVNNPVTVGERMYRTGDLARFNRDGSVELIGRKDNQIKLHGLRIELDEIEHALYEHSMVGRACVLPLVTDSTSNHKALVAFLTFNDLVTSDSAIESASLPERDYHRIWSLLFGCH